MTTKILLVEGHDNNNDNEYIVDVFDKNFNIDDVYSQIVQSSETQIELIHEQQQIIVSLHEFDDIDPKFISFVREHIEGGCEQYRKSFIVVGEKEVPFKLI